MRNPFKLDCLKPKTKGDDDSLLRYPGPIDDKGGGFRGLGGGGTSSKWQTPPLGKGARHHSQAFQDSPGCKISAHHEREVWCGRCVSRAEALEQDHNQTKAELEACKKSQGILKAKSRVLEMICTNIRERYNTLNLPAQISCPEPGAHDAVEDMMHPDQRAIVAAGRKVNAMFETISQVNKNVLQANSDLKTELDAAKAARRLAEWESSEVNKMNTARGQAIHNAKRELQNVETENRVLKDALAKALHDLGRDGDFEAYGYHGGYDDTPCQSLNPSQQNALSGRFKENEGSVQSHSFDGPPLRQNGVNRAQYMNSSLSGEKLKVLRQQKPTGSTTAEEEGQSADRQQEQSPTPPAQMSGEASFRNCQCAASIDDTGRALKGHAADVAALSEYNHSPLRPPVALQRSPVRGHRRQLSTVAEEAHTPASAAARRALPMLNLEPLTQLQEQYRGPQELYQSTAYTSEATEVRTSATASNLSDAAVQSGGQAMLANLPRQADYAEADSAANEDDPPLISFTPVAKLAKIFQPGPSRLSNPGKLGSADEEVAASKHFSPLKHHVKACKQVPLSPEAAGSRLAVGAGPRESHLDFFLRDAAAATAKYRTSQGPGAGPLQKHIKASATAHGFFGNYESAVQQQQAQGRSRGNSSVSSHSNPLFSSAPGGDLDASVDIQSAALPTVHEVPSEAAELLEPSQRTDKEDVKQSVVASTSISLLHRMPNQASMPFDGQQDQPGTADQAESGDVEQEEEEDQVVREKTPDTNVKLNQPLRCGRYGQDLIPSRQHNAADMAQYQAPRLGAGGKANPALIASRQSTSAAPKVPKAAQAKLSNPKARVLEGSLLPPVSDTVQQPRVGQTAGAIAKRPVQTASVAPGPAGRTVPAGPAPTSVDELLTGPVPRGNVMTASMAGAAAAMAESAAAMAGGIAADREAVKAALGHHYRQYRAKKAAAEERAKAAPPKPRATAAADHLAGGVCGNSESAEHEEVPLRVKYGTSSSSGGSRQAFSNRSQDTANSSSFGQQHAQQSQEQHAQHNVTAYQQQQQQQQHDMHRQAGQSTTWAGQHQTASRIQYRHSSAVQAQQGRQLHQQPQARVSDRTGFQPAAPEDVEMQLGNAANEQHGDVRKSNEKLDMLLQSTVKRTQRAVFGKENKVLSGFHAAPKATGGNMEASKALRDYRH